MNQSNYFSPSYAEAREHFRAASSTLGYEQTAYEIDQTGPTGESLTIDVTLYGSSTPQYSVILSSGLHGVEGFFGSALQLALLDEIRLEQLLSSNTRIILIHALNPYGFAWLRRWNEDNVDLNRNFLLPSEEFKGSPPAYANFDSFLNPATPPFSLEPYSVKALWLIAKYGMSSLKNTLPVGQYDFPKGLFFGGSTPSKTQEILKNYLPAWIGGASEVIHLDLHTGLGQWGTYRLWPDDSITAADPTRIQQRFGSDAVSISKDVGYPIQGGLGRWCQNLLPNCHYQSFTAEFGTYSSVQVLKALRAENRAHWWGKPGRSYKWTKRLLVEMFAPTSAQWRQQCLTQGLKICRRALAG
jgi:Protein of unknown function (DUF2817)